MSLPSSWWLKVQVLTNHYQELAANKRVIFTLLARMKFSTDRQYTHMSYDFNLLGATPIKISD
jgi:hypothetical protein